MKVRDVSIKKDNHCGDRRLTLKTTEQDIEFIGGPFDGHTQSCDLPATRLPVDVV